MIEDMLHSPLFALVLTLSAYKAAEYLSDRFARPAWLNPVLIAILAVMASLWALELDYEVYFDGAWILHFLLGPATVALAVPLYREARKLGKNAMAILVSVIIGALTATGLALALGLAFGLDDAIRASLAPKTVTTPVAMDLADLLGGWPSLAAALVILAGILGAVALPPLLTGLGLRDQRAQGLALGVASHGIGTARALQIARRAGAYSALAMGSSALLTALVLPLVWPLVSS